MRLSNSPNPLIGFLYVLMLVGSVAALVFLDQLAWFFLLVLLVLLLLLLWWLFYGNLGKPEYPPEEFFVQDEVIVHGPASAVITAVQSANVTLTEKDRIEFSKLTGFVKNCLGDCSPLDYNDFVIILYKLEGSKDAVSNAIRAINQVVGPGSSVRAEPNWLSGRRFAIAGQGLEPWDPTGSGEQVLGEANPDLYMTQWALNKIKLHGRKDALKGNNVRIGFFDTSPFRDKESSLLESALSWVTMPEPLKVDEYHDYVDDNKKYNPDQSGHGLFVMGMAHAIAPRIETHLYRVLNDDNQGDLFVLMKALFDFIRQYAAEKFPDGEPENRSELVGAVINLSLGIRLPPEQSGINLPAELQAFRDLLQAAKCVGIVVVAAAGNDSTSEEGNLPASLPANWPEVIGVAASNQDGVISCFSNVGNLGAPGGECIDIQENVHRSVDSPGYCNKDQDCRYAIVGPVLQKDGNTGYVFWAGTSFAAPMVAGLAALVIECGNGLLSPDEVRRIIEEGADGPGGGLGKGIINIPKTLARCSNSSDDVKDRPEQTFDDDDRQSAE